MPDVDSLSLSLSLNSVMRVPMISASLRACITVKISCISDRTSKLPLSLINDSNNYYDENDDDDDGTFVTLKQPNQFYLFQVTILAIRVGIECLQLE